MHTDILPSLRVKLGIGGGVVRLTAKPRYLLLLHRGKEKSNTVTALYDMTVDVSVQQLSLQAEAFNSLVSWFLALSLFEAVGSWQIYSSAVLFPLLDY